MRAAACIRSRIQRVQRSKPVVRCRLRIVVGIITPCAIDSSEWMRRIAEGTLNGTVNFSDSVMQSTDGHFRRTELPRMPLP
jgi:hypothetical protein